jgi:hypothetical protein
MIALGLCECWFFFQLAQVFGERVNVLAGGNVLSALFASFVFHARFPLAHFIASLFILAFF